MTQGFNAEKLANSTLVLTGDPLSAIGMLTMQLELHRRGQCDCGKTVDNLQDAIDLIVKKVMTAAEKR